MKKLKDLELFEGPIPTEGGEHPLGRNHFIKPEISPYLIYIILKENFGEPNNENYDEGKTQWQWLFKYGDIYVEIYDWKLYTASIGIYQVAGNQKRCEELGDQISGLLAKASHQKRGIIKGKVKNAQYKLLENPFITYYSTAENLLSIAKTIEELLEAKASSTINTHDLWFKQYDLYRSAFLMFLSSFEGFLNILYELYLKPELRADRLYEKISREQIDIKLRIAPIYCDGFKVNTISSEDERFRHYLRLVNLRNDYVHANLVKSLESYIITEDDRTFIVQNEEIADIPSNISQLELCHVEKAQMIINDIIELVFESMNSKTRREFKRIISYPEIEVAI